MSPSSSPPPPPSPSVLRPDDLLNWSSTMASDWRFMFRGPLESGAPPPWAVRHALPAAASALRGRGRPQLSPRSLVQILPLSSSDILVLISNCLYKHPHRFGARPHLWRTFLLQTQTLVFGWDEKVACVCTMHYPLFSLLLLSCVLFDECTGICKFFQFHLITTFILNSREV